MTASASVRKYTPESLIYLLATFKEEEDGLRHQINDGLQAKKLFFLSMWIDSRRSNL
jgi:hypothetical protein